MVAPLRCRYHDGQIRTSRHRPAGPTHGKMDLLEVVNATSDRCCADCGRKHDDATKAAAAASTATATVVPRRVSTRQSRAMSEEDEGYPPSTVLLHQLGLGLGRPGCVITDAMACLQGLGSRGSRMTAERGPRQAELPVAGAHPPRAATKRDW